jgi:uncharacterized membrane protein
METWVVYAVLAALSWGTYIVLNKMAFQHDSSLNPFTVAMMMGLGIIGLFGIIFFLTQPQVNLQKPDALVLSIIAGALWGLGQIFAILALVNRAPVSRLTPIYNTNTLVAVLLGIILLKELPAGTEKIKVIIGAALIVVGGILVSS